MIPLQASTLWQAAALEYAQIQPEPESTEYAAHTLLLGGRLAVFRQAKTTPTKLGQFVTLWQRSLEGPIRPFDTDDGVELFIIHAGLGTGLGQFVFPLAVLARHGVVSIDGKGGKRAMRVYPPEVVTTSAQAQRPQKWQCEYFVAHDAPAERVRELFSA